MKDRESFQEKLILFVVIYVDADKNRNYTLKL